MTGWRLLWAALAVAALLMAVLLPEAALWPPAEMQLPTAGWISAAMLWLTDHAAIGPVTFRSLTRGFAALVEAPYDAARILLVDGITDGKGRRAATIIPPLSWLAVTAAAVALGHYARDLWLGLLAGR